MINDEWGGMGSSTNAYVLIYEKQLKSDITLGMEGDTTTTPY